MLTKTTSATMDQFIFMNNVVRKIMAKESFMLLNARYMAAVKKGTVIRTDNPQITGSMRGYRFLSSKDKNDPKGRPIKPDTANRTPKYTGMLKKESIVETCVFGRLSTRNNDFLTKLKDFTRLYVV